MADIQAESRDGQIKSLTALVSKGTATVANMQDLARMLQEKAAEEMKASLGDKIAKIKKVIEDEGFTIAEAIKHLSEPPAKIFEWENEGKTYTRMEGERGRMPDWVSVMTAKITEGQAEKFIVGNHPKGKAFVKSIYSK